MEKTATLTLSREDFIRHPEACPQMAVSIMQSLTLRLRFTTAQAKSLAFRDIYGRAAMRLLDLAGRYDTEKGSIELDLSLTQPQLATWVGTTRESVSKVLGAHPDLGLIHVDGQRITVLDHQKLKGRVLY